MPREPLSLDDSQLAEVETLAAVLTAEQVADYFGIARRSFYRLMERDREVAARYKRGKARAVGAIAQGLIQKARAGNVTAMIFFLKTQGGWRETLALAPVAPEDARIDVASLSDAALAELIAVFEREQDDARAAEACPVALPR